VNVSRAESNLEETYNSLVYGISLLLSTLCICLHNHISLLHPDFFSRKSFE
jgi:hypothetical protein